MINLKKKKKKKQNKTKKKPRCIIKLSKIQKKRKKAFRINQIYTGKTI